MDSLEGKPQLRLELLRFDNTKPESLIEVIARCLPKAGMFSMVPRITPLQAIVSHVIRLKACTAIIQNEVQDPDFIAEHAAYYSLLSQPIPRYCTRLHFFSIDPETDDLLGAIDVLASSPSCYLGFVTLRPVWASPVGATILSVPSDQQSFVLAVDEFPVHLAGRHFKVTGTPFLQQDSAVGACAQASIWMALRTLRSRAGHSAFSPAEITSVATRFLASGRTFPNKGLEVPQIVEAIRATGYAPHILNLRDVKTTATDVSLDAVTSAIYPYLESRIPVLLILMPPQGIGHAVLAIGHGWKSSLARDTGCEIVVHDGLSITTHDSANWIEPLIVHNDNSGPYLQLTRDDTAPYHLGHAAIAIPFLPPDVFLDGAEARQLTMALILQCLLDYQQENGPPRPRVVLRTYLQDRSTFREAVFASSMPDELKRYYRLKWLPKRVWVTEINALEGYGDAPNGTCRRLGEVVLDPTTTIEEAGFLTIHLTSPLLRLQADKGVVIDRDCKTGDITARPIGEGAYSPLVRDRV
ncbi:MAG TPA: hypothetical protein VGE57_09100 [Solimonas sp.]